LILITGSSGFIGTNLTQYFIDKEQQVTGLDLAKPYKEFQKKLFTYHSCDLTDKEAVRKAFEKYKPKTVLHFAFITHRKEIYSEFLDDARITLNMLEAALKNRVDRFLLMSSSTVYGLRTVDAPVSEEEKLTPKDPKGTYGRAKLMAELMARQYFEAENLPITVFRGFEIYGPILTIPSIVRILLDRAVKKEPMKLFCYGKQKTDFTYVEDLARAIELVLSTPRTIGDTLNVGSGKVYTFEEFANTIGELLPAKVELLPPRPNEKPFYLYSNIEKLKTLGFKPKYDIMDGLKKTVDWMLTQHG
jgi:nucleoside-diphosphate-sugar epimerase